MLQKGTKLHKLSGKIVSAKPNISNSALHVGKRLRELRQLADMTQCEVAAKLSIGQTALSRLEQRADVHVSTLRNYIEALGASLRIDAAFDGSSPLVLKIHDAFEIEYSDDNQLVLPIFEDEKFRPHRDVVLSIRPQYSEPIVEGLKTVELRRRFPISVPAGTYAYIYSTSPTRALTGVAQIQAVRKKSIEEIWKDYSDTAFIEKTDFDDYFKGLEFGFAIEFTKARKLKRSLSLEELRDRFDFEPPQSFLYAKPLLREALKYESSTLPD